MKKNYFSRGIIVIFIFFFLFSLFPSSKTMLFGGKKEKPVNVSSGS